MSKNRDLLISSIKHHERMLKWVEKTRNKKGYVNGFVMKSELGEVWGQSDCSLCQEYLNRACYDCPLAQKYGKCNEFNERNAWSGLGRAKNWGEWIKVDKKLIKQLKNLIKGNL